MSSLGRPLRLCCLRRHANSINFSAACVAESADVAFAYVNLTPWLCRTSDYGAAIISPALLSCRCWRWFNALTWDVVMKESWKKTAGLINAWRVGSLGLPPCEDPHGPFWSMARPHHARFPLTVVNAGSTLMCIDERPASDWPANWPVVGPYLAPAPQAPPAELEAFLEASSDALPVVYIGFGSMKNPQPEALATLFVDACAAGCVRAIVGAGWTNFYSERSQSILRPALESRSIFLAKEAPHAWIFPRVAAVVHHCGVGTTNVALASGVPQVRRGRVVLRTGAGLESMLAPPLLLAGAYPSLRRPARQCGARPPPWLCSLRHSSAQPHRQGTGGGAAPRSPSRS